MGAPAPLPTPWGEGSAGRTDVEMGATQKKHPEPLAVLEDRLPALHGSLCA